MAMTIVRVALRLVPFRVVQRIRFVRSRHAVRPEEIVRACERVARRIAPRATCLVRVLTAAILFGRYGHPAAVRLGVARTEGDLAAHAWLESEGRVVLGERNEFVALCHDGTAGVVRMGGGDLDLRERRLKSARRGRQGQLSNRTDRRGSLTGE